MKKLLTIMLALVLGIACLGLVACGGGDGDGNTGLAGSYKLKSMVYDGTSIALGQEAPWGDDILSADTNTLEIKNDGTWTNVSIVASQEVTLVGTWTYENDVLTMTQTTPAPVASLVCTVLENGDISMTSNMGMEITYIFTKS